MNIDEDFLMKCRETGRKRIEISVEAESSEDWEDKWEPPENQYFLQFGNWWKMTVEYCVKDFEAEVGFYTDILGFSVNALGPAYGMFTNSAKDFHISIAAANSGRRSTPKDAIVIEFMVDDILKHAEEYKSRGIIFHKRPSRYGDVDSKFMTAKFKTPNGIGITLVGFA